MEHKTKIHAEDAKQEIIITREFELPVELLFKAYTDAELFEQWMSHDYGKTKVLKLENQKLGSWRFETSDLQGNVVFGASGVFHDFVLNEKITRTFEMDNSPFDVQLEFLEFEKISEETSKLTIHSIYRSTELRDQMLKLPFAHGLNAAHDRLQQFLSK